MVLLLSSLEELFRMIQPRCFVEQLGGCRTVPRKSAWLDGRRESRSHTRSSPSLAPASSDMIVSSTTLSSLSVSRDQSDASVQSRLRDGDKETKNRTMQCSCYLAISALRSSPSGTVALSLVAHAMTTSAKTLALACADCSRSAQEEAIMSDGLVEGMDSMVQ
jgi:hypothetical protein